MTIDTRPENLIEGATGPWEVVIGLEVHAQITSKSKLFSGASTEFGGEPNNHVSLVDAAMPGMLPVINQECVAQAIRTGLGLKAQINLFSVFVNLSIVMILMFSNKPKRTAKKIERQECQPRIKIKRIWLN